MRMFFITIGVAVCTMIVIVFFQSLLQSHSTLSLRLPHETISLIVADTPMLRESGLSGVKYMPENTAMLFIFDKPDKYEFWMKEMKFPLDMIWLDKEYKIVHIETDLSPSTYPKTFAPTLPSLYVIEANAGLVTKNNLKIGDNLNIF